MIHVLVITVLWFAANGEPSSTQETIGFKSAQACAEARAHAHKLLSQARPSATVIVGCVPIEAPVKS